MTARYQTGSWNCKAWSKSASFRSLPKRKKEAAWVVANYLKYAASLRPELSRGYEKTAKDIFSGSNLPKAIKRAFPTLKVLQVTKLSKLIIDSAADAQRLSKRASCGVGPTGSKIIKIRKKKKPVSAKVTLIKKMAEAGMEKEAFWGAILKALGMGAKALKAVPMFTRGAATAARAIPKVMKGVDKGSRLSTLRGAFRMGSRGGNVGKVFPKGGVQALSNGAYNPLTSMSSGYNNMGRLGQMGWSIPGAAIGGGILGGAMNDGQGGGYAPPGGRRVRGLGEGGRWGPGGRIMYPGNPNYNDNYSSTGGGYDSNGQYHGVSDAAANHMRSNGGGGGMYGGRPGGRGPAGYGGDFRNYGQEQWRNSGGGGGSYEDGMRDGSQAFKIKQLRRRKKRLQAKIKPPAAPAPVAPPAPAPTPPPAPAAPASRGGPLYINEDLVGSRS